MGANAATKVYRMIDNLEKILGIELMNAAQALEFRRPLKSSKPIEELVAEYRKIIPFVNNDIEMHPAMKKSIEFVQQYSNKLGVKDFL
jgi:histidine ammonia-lyase